MMTSQPRQKLLRVQSSRSTSGCRSCKARHVKCDEGQPTCQKCIKARIPCQYGAFQLHSTKFVIYSVPRSLPDIPQLNPPERRSLHYFRCHAAAHMAAPFHTKSWIYCVLQLAEGHTFVMSALLALSTIHESYSQTSNLREHYQSIFFHHYNSAMKEISRADHSEIHVHAILISSIVFYSFETLRGCLFRALQHVQAGLKIISYQHQLPALDSRQPSALAKSIIRDFLSLQNQIMEVGSPAISRAYDVIRGFEPPLPDQFKSIDDALYYIEVIYSETHCIIDHFEDFQDSDRVSADILTTEIEPRSKRIRERQEKWSIGFASLEASLGECAGRQERQAVLILRVYQIMTKLVLDNLFTGDCFTRFDIDIARVLELIEIFLRGESQGSREYHPTFSLSIGIVAPLFMIASRCNYIPLRDKSLKLLALARRREGIWDSKMAFQLAKRCIEIKSIMAGIGNRHHIHVSNIRFVSDTAFCVEFCFVEPAESLGIWFPPQEMIQSYKYSEIVYL